MVAADLHVKVRCSALARLVVPSDNNKLHYCPDQLKDTQSHNQLSKPVVNSLSICKTKMEQKRRVLKIGDKTHGIRKHEKQN